MKVISSERANLASCINDSKQERVVITREGKPVALIVGIEGLDQEQLELGTSDKFWKLIRERRKQQIISRAELERTITGKRSGDGKQARRSKRR